MAQPLTLSTAAPHCIAAICSLIRILSPRTTQRVGILRQILDAAIGRCLRSGFDQSRHRTYSWRDGESTEQADRLKDRNTGEATRDDRKSQRAGL